MMFDVIQRHSQGTLEVYTAGIPLWQYRYAHTPKPHVFGFATPAGHNTTLASPHDHVHHRGLMFGFTVDDVNFWEEQVTDKIPQTGAIVHRGFSKLEAKADTLCIEQSLAWQHGETIYLKEDRLIRVSLEHEAAAVRCDWTSRLSPVGGPRALTGVTPHAKVTYQGFGCRFVRALDWGGTHLTPTGPMSEAPEPGQSAKWHDYSGRLDESHAPVGVWIGDAPTNPRHPTPWVCRSHPPMPFALVSASLLAHEPYPLEPGEQLSLSYSAWAHDGQWTSADGDRAWAKTFDSLNTP